MGSQQMYDGGLPVESYLRDMVSNSRTDKIKRPPNAFMLFGREHRKDLRKQHPELGNKDISILLGKKWTGLPDEIKTQYHHKANLIEKFHKEQYPGYSYSPIEARRRKMLKQEKRKAVPSSAHIPAEKNVLQENGPNKGPTSDCSHEQVATGSSYVENKPEYIVPPSAEMLFGGKEKLSPSADIEQRTIAGEHYIRGQLPPENRIEPEVNRCYNLPYRRQEAFYFPENVQHSRDAPPACCSPPEHRSGSMSSYFCGQPTYCNQVPRSDPPPYYPYWPSQRVNSPIYYQRRPDSHEDLRPFAYTMPCCPSEYCRPSFGYVDRSAVTNYNTSDFRFYPQFTANMTRCQATENEFLIKNTKPNEYLGQLREAHLTSPCQRNLSREDRLRILLPRSETTGYLPSSDLSQSTGDMPNYASHLAYASKGVKNACNDIDTQKSCDESVAAQRVINFQNADTSNSCETNSQKLREQTTFCENESSMLQMRRIQDFPSKVESAEIFDGVSDIEFRGSPNFKNE